MALRRRGHSVEWPVILGWLGTGLAAGGLTITLGSGRVASWLGLLVLLTPWMLHALVGDWQRGNRLIAAIDAAGLSAIAWSLWSTFAVAWGR